MGSQGASTSDFSPLEMNQTHRLGIGEAKKEMIRRLVKTA